MQLPISMPTLVFSEEESVMASGRAWLLNLVMSETSIFVR